MKQRFRKIISILIALAFIATLLQLPAGKVEAGSKINTISLTLDINAINLNTDDVEDTVDDRIREDNVIKLNTGGTELDLDNSGLSFQMKSGIIDGASSPDYNVRSGRKYYYRICLTTKTGWSYHSSLLKRFNELEDDLYISTGDSKISDYLNITVNGKKLNDGLIEIFASDESEIDMIYLYIPATVKTGSKPIKIPDIKTISYIELGYDPSYVNLTSGQYEGEVDQRIYNSAGSSTEGCLLVSAYLGEMAETEEGIEFWGIGEGEDKVKTDKKYYICMDLAPADQDYYLWPANVAQDKGYVPLSSVSGFNVTVNGRQAKTDAYLQYNYTWNQVSIFVPYSSEAPENKSSLIDISKATITGVTDMKYTGEEVYPDYDLYYDSKKLKEAVDYNAIFTDNTNEGTATITFVGIGKYTGTVKRTFKISKDVADYPDKDNKNNDNKNPANYKNEWVNGKWYDENGLQTYSGILSWKSNATGWWVEDSSGWYPVSKWQKIDGKWYYFTETGYMDYSEYRDGCWLGDDGAWVETYYGGHWCSDATGWWYEDASGWYPVNQYVWIDGVHYWFNSNGYWE